MGRAFLLFVGYIIPHEEFGLNVLPSSDFGTTCSFLWKGQHSITDTPLAGLNLLLTRWGFQICMHLFQYQRTCTNISF